MLHSFCIIALLVAVVSATPGRSRPLDALPELPTSPSGFVFSPYKDITADCDWNTLKMRSDVTGKTLPITHVNQHTQSIVPSWILRFLGAPLVFVYVGHQR